MTFAAPSDTAPSARPNRFEFDAWRRWAVTTSGSVALLVVGGLAAGLAAKIADGTTWRWASDLGTFPAAWLFTLVLIGHFSRSLILAAGRSVAFFAAVVASYYAWSAWVLEFGVRGYPAVWFVVACTLAPAMAAMVWAASHTRFPAWLVAGSTAALLLAEGPLRQYWNVISTDLPAEFTLHPAQAIVDVVLAAATIGLLTRSASDRSKAAVLVLPMIWFAELSLGIVQTAVI